MLVGQTQSKKVLVGYVHVHVGAYASLMTDSDSSEIHVLVRDSDG